MAKLKIKGWDTGINKTKMIEILVEALEFSKDESKELINAVSEGQVITLDMADAGEAEEMYDKLTAVGAIVETSDE
ncbi:MAG: hypothetical protein R2681_11435 [Pyrinomonadaceae bacterium]